MSNNTNAPYHGSCLCGDIRYEVAEIELRMGHCHCSMCRKFHGAAFASLGEATRENFTWTAGESLLSSFKAANGTERQFCSRCGSSMIFKASNDMGELVEFALGTLDSDIPHEPDAHIFVDSKSSWAAIDDDLPKFSAGRASPKINLRRI